MLVASRAKDLSIESRSSFQNSKNINDLKSSHQDASITTEQRPKKTVPMKRRDCPRFKPKQASYLQKAFFKQLLPRRRCTFCYLFCRAGRLKNHRVWFKLPQIRQRRIILWNKTCDLEIIQSYLFCCLSSLKSRLVKSKNIGDRF